MMSGKMIAWDNIVCTLEAWRAGLDDPSVTTIAEKYHHDPWAVLTSTILSLRTKDELTLRASEALLKKAPTPEALLNIDIKELQEIIFPVGFYRTKALNLQRIAQGIIEKHKGKVPCDLDELLALPGVGRKTANLVMIEAFDKDGICVDTHVHRICNRAAWLQTSTPDQTEMHLRKILPLKHWKKLNALLVLYGQQLCRPISPFCSKCLIKEYCAAEGIGKSR
ncbi:MAG: endonuclease III [Spirochaetaceae bacterium]|jgi:endonuclease-3|nr:endonuclease III [Spirochaetaceae bacterium]